MDGERDGETARDVHDRAGAIFLRASDLAPAERSDFVARACGDDAELRAAVDELLAHDADDTFLEQGAPATRVAGQHPEHVGAYRIRGVLGQGGMGIVYEAEQQKPRRTVALKVVRPGWLSTQALLRFEHEAEVLGRLQHPGIAQIHEAGTADAGFGRQPFLAMERVDGAPLDAWLSRERPDLETRLELMTKICDAVHHAHQKGVIHRDLKPSNILIDRSGQPKILDFGIARATDADVEAATLLTSPGTVVGTLRYMSPEQARGSRDLDVRSDVYALGVILYEMLAGVPPYELGTISVPAAARIVVERAPRPLGAVDRRLRGDLETIVHKALAKQPEQRYPSASELAADLGRFARDEPIEARPPSTFYQLRKFTVRHRVLVGALGAVVLALAVGLVLTIRGERRASAALADFDRLADRVALRRALDATQRVRPAWPENTAAIRAWIERRGAPLAARLIGHRDHLHTLRQRADSVDALGSEHYEFAAERDQLLHDGLTSLVAELAAFADPVRGTLAQMRADLEWSEQVRELSVERHRASWQRAAAAIAAHPRYAGLELRAQLGLVPLGENPHTGLWEFYHLRSAADPETLPRRDPRSSSWVVGEDTGIVFVLVPGGTFGMGAQDRDPAGANYDAGMQPDEPLHSVTLDTFFVAAHETTQGQWQRMSGGDNPSYYVAGHTAEDGTTFTMAHPVEYVTWPQCRDLLARHGLALPTEAQWEYACRAGETTAFSCGQAPESLRGHANVADRTRALQTTDVNIEPWDDGWVATAPVGAFAPNRFGLYDVHGNVWEWCADAYRGDGYRFPAAPADGLRRLPGSALDDGDAATFRACRGGAFIAPAAGARSANRNAWPEDTRYDTTGLRPARRLR